MKKFYLPFLFVTIFCLGLGQAQTQIDFDASIPEYNSDVDVDTNNRWSGFMAVFNLGAYPAEFIFGQGWGLFEENYPNSPNENANGLVALLDSGTNTVTIKPPRIGPDDDFWNFAPGPVQFKGNKTCEASLIYRRDDLLNTAFDYNFSITENSLTGSPNFDTDYSIKAFITVFDQNFNVTDEVFIENLDVGDYTISWSGSPTDPGPGPTNDPVYLQMGFQLVGPNITPSAGSFGSFNQAYANMGQIVVTSQTLSANKFSLNDLVVYPNPTTDGWNIKTDSQAIQAVTVYDVLGKAVMQAEPNAFETKIDATALTKGVYFAKIQTLQGASTVRLVKN